MLNTARSAPKRIAVLTFSEVTRDPRIQRAVELMVQRGHEVRVYTLQLASKDFLEDYQGFRIIRLPVTNRYYTVERDAFRAAFKDLSPLIDVLWPDVLAKSWRERQGASAALPSRAALVKHRVAARLHAILTRSTADATLEPTPSSAPSTRCYLDSLIESRDIDDTYWRMQVNLELFRVVGSWATHVYANDLDTLFAGVMLKQAYHVCLIYDAHEIWPHQWAENDRSAHFLGFFSTMEKAMLRYTDERVTVAEGLAKYFEYAYASPPFTVVYNTPSLKYLCDERTVRRRSARRGLLYHGIYTPFRGLEEIIAATPILDDCRIGFRGLGAHEAVLRSCAAEKGVSDRVEFLPPVELHDLVAAATDFDIGLLPFVNVCLNTHYVFPNKLFEYMMAGLALASNDLVDQKRIIQAHQMGVVFDVTSPAQVAEQLNNLLRDPDRLDTMRLNAWTAARDIYNWENSSLEFVNVLERCDL